MCSAIVSRFPFASLRFAHECASIAVSHAIDTRRTVAIEAPISSARKPYGNQGERALAACSERKRHCFGLIFLLRFFACLFYLKVKPFKLLLPVLCTLGLYVYVCFPLIALLLFFHFYIFMFFRQQKIQSKLHQRHFINDID